MKKLLVAATVAIIISNTAWAAGNTNTGCGLGSMLIPNQDTVSTQVLAVTSNALGSQTFAITSGSLNCTKPYKLAMNDKAQHFVADNMDAIAVDVASGQGESLDTLLSLMHVTDKVAAVAKLKASFSTIYSHTGVTSAQVVDGIVSTL